AHPCHRSRRPRAHQQARAAVPRPRAGDGRRRAQRRAARSPHHLASGERPRGHRPLDARPARWQRPPRFLPARLRRPVGHL
ncbi:MAG: hypothetical protein AVDCRST_MAG69-2024, partial [uncultured Solirubrobacteraceae bacterium]